MTAESVLKGKVVLVVDDEPDVLDSVEEELDMCIIQKAQDYKTALQYLASYNYDIVILDIMGVRGFDLLKESVSRGFPTVMLTAHALSPESLKKSIKLGAVSFLPKDKIAELRSFLADVVLGEGKPVWQKVFGKLGGYFKKRFGSDWEEKDRFFQDFQDELKQDMVGKSLHLEP
jgi:CheY-like chemotaxis protein